ncbi:MAG: hypothetical protein ACFFCI_09755 [Promethearchaeota archaeon]
MPKCPYCEAALAIEELEFQRVKVRKKIPKTPSVRFITAVLCPKCDSILNAKIGFR